MNISFCQTNILHSGSGIAVKTQLATVINDWAKILDNKGQIHIGLQKGFDIPKMNSLKCFDTLN